MASSYFSANSNDLFGKIQLWNNIEIYNFALSGKRKFKKKKTIVQHTVELYAT